MAAPRARLTGDLVSVGQSLQLRGKGIRSMLLPWCKSPPAVEAILFCNNATSLVSSFFIKTSTVQKVPILREASRMVPSRYL